jgi:hypothetical protein
MRRPFFWVAILGLALGVSAGWFFPSSTRAATTVEWWFNVPVGIANNTNVQMTCGFHQTCGSPPTAGIAIDWASASGSGSTGVFIRGAGLDPGCATTCIRAYAHWETAPNFYTTCDNNSKLDVFNSASGSHQVTLVYTHTINDYLGTKYLQYKSGSPYLNSPSQGGNYVGTDPSCPISGPHVHNFGCGGSGCHPTPMYHNTSFPTGDPCNPTCPTYNNNTWTHYYNFTY